jgi:hypothetical protein
MCSFTVCLLLEYELLEVILLAAVSPVSEPIPSIL